MERFDELAALNMDYEGRGCAGEQAPPGSGWIEIDRDGNQIPIPGKPNRTFLVPNTFQASGSKVVFELDLQTLEFVPSTKK